MWLVKTLLEVKYFVTVLTVLNWCTYWAGTITMLLRDVACTTEGTALASEGNAAFTNTRCV